MSDDYISHKYGSLKVIFFHEIDQPNIFYPPDAFATALVEVKNGLVSNHVECVIYDDQIDADGNPLWSEVSIAPYMRSDLHSNVCACLSELKLTGVFSKEMQIQTLMLDGLKRSILVGKWSETAPELPEVDVSEVLKDDYNVPFQEGFVSFLWTKVLEIESRGEFYSHGWYLLKICQFYFFSRRLTTNDGFNVGLLSAQMESKFTMERYAVRGKKNETSLKATHVSRRRNSSEKEKAILNRLRLMWLDLREKHPELAKANTTAAGEIFEEAKLLKPVELIIKSTGDIMAESTIAKKLAKLKRMGEIG